MKLPPGHVAGAGVVKPKCTGGFGERLMRTMGWQEGQGLGKEGTGIKEAIQVKKKEDTVGVGGNGSWAWGEKWWEAAFDSAAATVGDSGSSDSSDSDSDDEHVAAIAAAVNRDGTRTSASADELRLLASLSKGGRVAAGRFGGRDAKMARIRQQEAAHAAAAADKLGMPAAAPSGTTATAPAATGAAGAAAGGSEASDTTSEIKLSSGSGKGKRRKKAAAAGSEEPGAEPAAAEQPAKRQRIVIEPAVAAGPTVPFVPTPASGWWGAKQFASAGCLEGLDKAAAEAQRRRVTFDEDDQAAIFTAAHAGKTQGRVGLGQGTKTVKVGGVKWEGKRVSFEDGEEPGAAEAAAAGEEQGGGQQRLAATGSCTQLDALAAGGGRKKAGTKAAKRAAKRAGKQAHTAATAAAAAEGVAAAPVAGAGAQAAAAVKWTKLICRELQAAAGQQLQRKELQRRVVAAVAAKHGSIAGGTAALKAAFCERLAASGRWVVEGKSVRLRA